MRSIKLIVKKSIKAACIASIVMASTQVMAQTKEEVAEIYLSNRAALIEGYQNEGAPLAADYVTWQAAATGPADPGVHSGRQLMTFVNDVGHSTYVEYASSDVDMPVGSIIAKESFKLKGGKFKAGPLFFMEKVGMDKAPDAGGWYYSALKANGKKMRATQKFCHGCHQAYAAQDSLGYPAAEVRLATAALVDSPAVAASDEYIGDAVKGKEAFQACAACHQIGADAGNGIGPSLQGIVGRPFAGSKNFNYSDGLVDAAKANSSWNEDLLFEWLAGPGDFLKAQLGDDSATSKMPISFSDPQLRKDIIAFLKDNAR